MYLENIYIDVINKRLIIEKEERVSDTGGGSEDFSIEKSYEDLNDLPLSDIVKLGELLESEAFSSVMDKISLTNIQSYDLLKEYLYIHIRFNEYILDQHVLYYYKNRHFIYSIFTRLLYYIDTRNNNNGIDTHYSLEFAAVTTLLINNNDNYYKFSNFLKDKNLKININELL